MRILDRRQIDRRKEIWIDYDLFIIVKIVKKDMNE